MSHQNDSLTYANQMAAQNQATMRGLGSNGMTDAERKVLELAMKQYDGRFVNEEMPGAGDFFNQNTLSGAIRALLFERLPPEYEQSMRAACFRAFDAIAAMNELEAKNPMGPEFTRKMRREWKLARGIED